MKLHYLFALLTTSTSIMGVAANKMMDHSSYPINPVPFTSVTVNDNFWNTRLEKNHKVTIPIAFHQSEITDRIKNFVQAAHPSDDNHPKGIFYDDSDVFKIIEGAAYSLQNHPDKRLEAYVDSLIDLIAAAQEPDGYLYTFRTMNPRNHNNKMVGERRWMNVERGSHELYNMGHLIEGAIAYYQATGKHKILDVSIKAADCICKAIGPNDDQLKIVPGHEELELALCKLYLITQDSKYLQQAKFFIDMRGRTETRSENIQAHLPITEQKTATGHAVRAGYLYSGIADVAALTGDQTYVNVIDTIWNDMVKYRLYLIGGIGSSRHGEAFGKLFELPNETAYNETCAAIALTFFNQRLFLLHGDSKYIDVLERSLYNGILSGLSYEGNTFFYPNPLTSHGNYKRSEWFGTACCPSNLCRFIPSLPGYIYAVKDRQIYANLYLSNQANLNIGGKNVTISQQTEYPWQGQVKFTIDKNTAGVFTLALRIPGWARGEVTPGGLYHFSDQLQPSYSVKVNGNDVSSSLEKGYFLINRKWKKGDVVELSLDMPIRTVKAADQVEADRHMTAIQRGPIVYCAEQADNPQGIFTMILPQKPTLRLLGTSTLPQGMPMIEAEAQHLSYNSQGLVETSMSHLTLIPYFYWCHRGAGQMKVWIPQALREIELE